MRKSVLFLFSLLGFHTALLLALLWNQQSHDWACFAYQSRDQLGTLIEQLEALDKGYQIPDEQSLPASLRRARLGDR